MDDGRESPLRVEVETQLDSAWLVTSGRYHPRLADEVHKRERQFHSFKGTR
jgi:hypothetical protein